MSAVADQGRPGAAVPSRPRVLSVAGTDPTGGAGIQADLKSFAAHGAYGMAVVTALVAQNTHGVRAVHVPDVAFLRAQLDAVSDDVDIDAAKIGMVATQEVAREIASWLARVRLPYVVVDPVMVATSGDHLLDAGAEQAVRDLLAHAHLVTPNLPELAVLLEEPVAQDWPEALDQGRRLAQRYDLTVLVKGGHLRGDGSTGDPGAAGRPGTAEALDDAPDAVAGPGRGARSPDAVVDATTIVELDGPRVRTTSTHGTGCSLSAAVTALRPRRESWAEAARDAKDWLTGALVAGQALRVGSGRGPVDHLHHLPGLGEPPFTRRAWAAVADVRAACDDLPFVRRLADGTLDPTEFAAYLVQDALYLVEYSRVLARASQQAPDVAAQQFWARGAHDALAVERELHRTWLVQHDGAPAARPSRVTRAYTDHLHAVAAHGSYAETVAAVLPCYWLYADIGDSIVARTSLDGHPYRDWVTTYADPAFAESTRRARALADTAEREAGPRTRTRMLDAFVTSSRFEQEFFAQTGTA